MSSKTTNYQLHKIDLNDAPPDITVINQNWDTIDATLNQHNEIITETDRILCEMTPEGIGAADRFHTHHPDEVGALAKDGGTVTGTITVTNSSAVAFKASRNTASKNFNVGVGVGNYNSDGAIAINLIEEGQSTYDVDMYFTRTNGIRYKPRGASSFYELLHTGNVTSGTSDIGAGATLATGAIYLVYE